MGQYYLAVNTKKREFLHPHDFDNGMKLMEHSWAENDFMGIVESLVSSGGRWHGDSLVWAGDYMDPRIFLDDPRIPGTPDGEGPTLHGVAQESFKRLSPSDVGSPSPSKKPFLLNATKKEYVDMKRLPKNIEGWSPHPLSLLVSSGNDRGGGDYKGTSMRFVGSWAGDEISMSDDAPENFVEIRPNFVYGTPLTQLLTGDEETPPEKVPETICNLYPNKCEQKSALAFLALCASDPDDAISFGGFSEETRLELRRIFLKNATSRTLGKAVKILGEAYSVVGVDIDRFAANMTDASLMGDGFLDCFNSDGWRAMNFVSDLLLHLVNSGEFETAMKFIGMRVGGKNLEYMERENVRTVKEMISKLTAHIAGADEERNGAGGGTPVL